MAELPDYQDRVTIGAGPAPGVSAIPLVSVPGSPGLASPVGPVSGGGKSTLVSNALGAFGTELAQIGQKMSEGIQHTRATEALSGFLDDNNEIAKKYSLDTDYATAEDRAREELDTKRYSRLEGIDDPQIRARTELQMKRSTIETAGTIRNASMVKQSDINRAGLDELLMTSARRVVTSDSDVERVAITNEIGSEVERLRAAGWIDARTAVAYGVKFKQQIDNAGAMVSLQKDPAEALRLLNDGKQFPSLDPVTRQSYIQQAMHAVETGNVVQWSDAAHFAPVRSQLAVGRLADPSQADRVFDAGILKLENATGQPDLVSDKGAIGLAQILPGTARDVARSLGKADVVALSDDDLAARLKSDPRLNVELGRTYFRQMATRYNGNVALAAAAYNAGPGNADRWKTAAEAQFGSTFTAAQLASVVDFKETRNYVTNLYKNADAPMDVVFTPAGQARAVNGVGAVITQQQSRDDQVVRAQASARRSSDPLIQRYQDGMAADPQAEISWRATQQAAAERGDAQAAAAIVELDQVKQRAPYIEQAYAMAPAMLDGVTSRLEYDVRTSPNVTQSMVLQLKAFQAVRDEVAKRRDSDPISLGERAKLYSPVDIDPAADPEDPRFRAALAARGANATTAFKVYQGSAAALKPEEASAMKARYTAAGSDDRFRIVQSLAASLPENVYRDTLKQIAGNDSGTQFVGMMARTRPDLAREIFHGQQLAQTEGVKDKVGDVRAALAAKLGGQIYISPDQQDAVINASLALAVARRAAAGNLYEATDSGAIERAIEDVAGPIVKRNGSKTAVPPGMTAGQFTGILDNLTDTSFDQFGGAYDRNGKPYSGAFLSSHAVLRQLQPGGSQYVVVLPQGRGGKDVPVWQAPDPAVPSAPLRIDLSRMSATRDQPLSPYQRGRAEYRGEINDRIQQTRRETDGVAP